jgi:hypothetical protein
MTLRIWMKTCGNCGRENDEGLEFCHDCGIAFDAIELLTGTDAAAESNCAYCGSAVVSANPRCRTCHNDYAPAEHPEEDMFFADQEAEAVPELALAADYEHGFPYPDWPKLLQQIEKSSLRIEQGAAWRKVLRNWLREISAGLGGNYRCYESAKFFLLAAEGRVVAQALLKFAEQAQAVIEQQFGKLAAGREGKCTLLAFSDSDDYYAYISRFYPEGTYNLSSGVCIFAGLAHIAWPFRYVYPGQRVVIHELVHYNLTGLQLPQWLDEGLAQRVESIVSQQPVVGLDREMAQRHREFWTPELIQNFWAGITFQQPDAAELSYHLGLLLVEWLAVERGQFLDFVRNADWADAGQDAAVQLLDRDLGYILSGLLGEGEWRPNRKRIAELLVPA